MGLPDDVPVWLCIGLFGGEDFPGPANLDQDALSRLDRLHANPLSCRWSN